MAEETSTKVEEMTIAAEVAVVLVLDLTELPDILLLLKVRHLTCCQIIFVFKQIHSKNRSSSTKWNSEFLLAESTLNLELSEV